MRILTSIYNTTYGTGGKISRWFSMSTQSNLLTLRTNLTSDLEVSRDPDLVQTENLGCLKANRPETEE